MANFILVSPNDNPDLINLDPPPANITGIPKKILDQLKDAQNDGNKFCKVINELADQDPLGLNYVAYCDPEILVNPGFSQYFSYRLNFINKIL